MLPSASEGSRSSMVAIALSGEGFVLRACAGGGTRLSSGLLQEGMCA